MNVPHYMKIVEWSEEDQCFIGSAPPLIGPCCHGASETGVLKQLEVIVKEWIEIYREDGRPLPEPQKEFSGKFLVRVKPELHKALALKAYQDGQSLNHYIEKALEGALSA